MDVIKKPIRLVVNEKSGFRNSNGTPIIIYDPRGMMFYDTRENDHTVWQFNLPAGEYFIDPKTKIVKMSNPVEYDLLPLPPIERTKRGNPQLFDIQFGENPYKATVFWDHRAMLFDNSLKDIPLPALVTIFQHECGHKYYKTEAYCDKYAYNEMIKAGYNPSQIGFAFVNTLSEKQLPRKNELVHSMFEGNTNYDCYDYVDSELNNADSKEAGYYIGSHLQLKSNSKPMGIWSLASLVKPSVLKKTISPGGYIGKIYSYVVAPDGQLWWQLTGDKGFGDGGYVKHQTGVFDMGYAEQTSSGKAHDDKMKELADKANETDIAGDLFKGVKGVTEFFGKNAKLILIILVLLYLAPIITPAIKSISSK